ncbi:hypothetical protein GCM10009851_09810 [Herbiconiux moechotypicola]|uniref:Uncharacterized protein n=1 Tax=Herbiconiux moechotypicola TaxID=637393 RepID=A0ABN3DCT8_9MICO
MRWIARCATGPTHPRHKAPVVLDDRVAQLEFGSLVYLFLSIRPPNAAGAGLVGVDERISGPTD